MCAAIIRRFDYLTPSTPPQWGVMSSTQMLQHLVLAFRMSIGEYPVAEAPSREHDSPLRRFLALTLPVQWPKGIVTIPETDVTVLQPPSTDFAHERADLITLIHRFAEIPTADLRPTHPLMGPLTRSQWMRWGFRHTDHHLRQFGC